MEPHQQLPRNINKVEAVEAMEGVEEEAGGHLPKPSRGHAGRRGVASTAKPEPSESAPLSITEHHQPQHHHHQHHQQEQDEEEVVVDDYGGGHGGEDEYGEFLDAPGYEDEEIEGDEELDDGDPLYEGDGGDGGGSDSGQVILRILRKQH